MPTGPPRLSPELLAIEAGGPTFAVSVNVTGLPPSPVEVAVSAFRPTTVPSIQLPTVAIPLALVV